MHSVESVSRFDFCTAVYGSIRINSYCSEHSENGIAHILRIQERVAHYYLTGKARTAAR